MKNLLFIALMLFIFITSLYSANPEKQQQWEAFKADFSGKCLASWDKMTGGPQKIIGENIALETKAIDQHHLAEAVSRFLKKYEALFNIKGSQIELIDVCQIEEIW